MIVLVTDHRRDRHTFVFDQFVLVYDKHEFITNPDLSRITSRELQENLIRVYREGWLKVEDAQKERYTHVVIVP